jgi:hypothetical protein
MPNPAADCPYVVHSPSMPGNRPERTTPPEDDRPCPESAGNPAAAGGRLRALLTDDPGEAVATWNGRTLVGTSGCWRGREPAPRSWI